jgi:carboxyl-terminal processing protease
MNTIKQFFKKFKAAIVITVIVISAFTSYSFVDNYFEISKNLDIFSTLFRELNTYYVDDTDPGKLMKKGIDSMLESLDPYTNYYPESEIEDYRFMTTGQYGGIGSQIRVKGEYIVISDPYEGYPAQKADLRAGDIILQVDVKSMKNKKSDDISKLLKGQPKTTVRLLIKREGEEKPFEKIITREEIKIKSVPYFGMINENTGYIRLTGFTENATNEVKDAFTELKTKNNIKSLVLDLRGNPGGLLNEAVNISNIFVNKGMDIVTTKGKLKDSEKIYKSINEPIDSNMPLVLLVNSGSASASEIVSGSLQDLDRGIIIGQRTFGKGLVQTTRPLSYNSQLKVTTAKYYIPSGRCIQALDYSHRNEDGSVGKVPDSLMKAFKTHNGRVVYDGGGILPDIVLEQEKYSNISAALAFSKMLIFDFATKYKSTHPTIAPAKDFRLSETEFNDFVAFISDKDYQYSTKSEKTLTELKDNIVKEKYYDDIKSEFEALKSKMSNNKKDDLVKNKKEITQLIEEEIVGRYYFQKGRTEARLVNDPEVAKAVSIINDSNTFASILKGTYKKESKK